jgi:low temperature requirement protein LtrA
MARRTIWQLPRLHEEGEHEERRVTWLELFYDLVFVVVIAQLSHHLAEHIDGGGVLGFALLFALIWWVWLGGTIYNERFETQNDLSSRVLTFTQMLPVAAMVLFIGLWLYGGWHDRRFWPVASRYVIGFSCSVALILLSLAVPPPWRFGLWAASLVSDLAIPLSTQALQARLPRFSTSKLPERFGLFVIIVLGEGIVSVVNGVAARPSRRWPRWMARWASRWPSGSGGSTSTSSGAAARARRGCWPGPICTSPCWAPSRRWRPGCSTWSAARPTRCPARCAG